VRVVLQRVSSASVRVNGGVVGSIGGGCLLLVGFTDGDGTEHVEWMADKVAGLRVFPDDAGNLCGLVGLFGFGPLLAAIGLVGFAHRRAGAARRTNASDGGET